MVVAVIDLVWYEKKRDWRRLWLRKKAIRHQEPISAHNMTEITALRPSDPFIADLFESQGVRFEDSE